MHAGQSVIILLHNLTTKWKCLNIVIYSLSCVIFSLFLRYSQVLRQGYQSLWASICSVPMLTSTL